MPGWRSTMGKRVIGTIHFLLTLLCRYSYAMHLGESQGRTAEVEAFQISSAKAANGDFDVAKPKLSALLTSRYGQLDDPTWLGVHQLCYPQGHMLPGFEGRPPHGLVLEKVFILVVPARGTQHHSLLAGFPPATGQCHFDALASRQSSQKIRAYPQMVKDYKQLHRSKSGLNVFNMLPSSEKCEGEDVSAFALSKMIGLGEYLVERYNPFLESLRKAGEDPIVASCEAEQDIYQSAAALLHGMLHEKQFARLQVKKLEKHIVRGMDSFMDCLALRDIDAVFKQAYKEEHELFNTRRVSFALPRQFYHSMGIRESKTAKEAIKSLSHVVCGVDATFNLCYEGRCLNISKDSIGQLMKAAALHNLYITSSDIFQAYSIADTQLYADRLFFWFADSEKPGHVFKVDVADDYFFLKILTALGHDMREPILPGARLVIEQYKKESGKGSAKFWKVLMNGQVITEDMTTCFGLSSNGFCGVDTIKARVKESVERSVFGSCTDDRDEL